jgi:hypothetical protein
LFQQITGLLTPGEAKDLKDMGYSQRLNSDFSSEIVQKIAKRYQKQIDDQEFVLKSPSYWRIETRPKGHPWHFDGCKVINGRFVDNHMAWCEYGTTALLTPPENFTGGNIYFEVDGEPQKVKDHYLNGVIYTAGKLNNPVRHMVEPHKGNRTVLLMFFAIKK